MSNVKGLPPAQDAMLGALEAMRRQLPQFIEHAVLMAKVKRAAYLAYVDAGFTAEQALELTKAKGLI